MHTNHTLVPYAIVRCTPCKASVLVSFLLTLTLTLKNKKPPQPAQPTIFFTTALPHSCYWRIKWYGGANINEAGVPSPLPQASEAGNSSTINAVSVLYWVPRWYKYLWWLQCPALRKKIVRSRLQNISRTSWGTGTDKVLYYTVVGNIFEDLLLAQYRTKTTFMSIYIS